MENLNPRILEDILNIININQFKIKSIKTIIHNDNCTPFYETKEKMECFLCELEFDFNSIFEIIKQYQILYENLSQKVTNYTIKESSLSLRLKELSDELKIANNHNEELKKENKILKSNTSYNFYPNTENEISKNEYGIYDYSTSRILDKNNLNLNDIVFRNNGAFKNRKLTYEYSNKLIYDYDGYIKQKNKDYKTQIKNIKKIPKINFDYNDYKKYEKRKNNHKVIRKSSSMNNIETPRNLSFFKEVLENKKKIDLLKKKFGNSIEEKIINGDINDDEIKNIKDFLMEFNNKLTSIIPKSKRFLIHNSKEKTKKNIDKNSYKMNNKTENRFVRQMIKNKSFNRLNGYSDD